MMWFVVAVNSVAKHVSRKKNTHENVNENFREKSTPKSLCVVITS
jgi:hypothetical protein